MRALKLGVAAALGMGLALGACAPEETETDLGTEGTETEATEPTDETLDVDFSEWDLDTDLRLSLEEFEAWWNENRPELGDEEGADREAVAERVHATWDTDDDDAVSEQEWREGTGADEDGGDWGTWTDWDGDGDSELDLNEVREGMEGNNVYDRIDRDQDMVLDDEELADWFFDLFDRNDDDHLDTTEWDRRGAWRDDIGLEPDADEEPDAEATGAMNG